MFGLDHMDVVNLKVEEGGTQRNDSQS